MDAREILHGNHSQIAPFLSQANCAVLLAGMCVKAGGSGTNTLSMLWGGGWE